MKVNQPYARSLRDRRNAIGPAVWDTPTVGAN